MQIEEEKGIPTNQSYCLIVIGMAGSGKTTFVSQFTDRNKAYAINLDPAVKTIPYQPYIDIRETYEYRKVMKDYQLGPNGAILTSLNLYTSQPQKLIDKMQKAMVETPGCIFVIDIPGQIEAFTWSASSMILTKAIALLMPVVMAYVVDSERCQNPNSFLSNLLFAQSIQCRIDLPLIICLNKVDIVDNTNCKSWIKDYETFTEALHKNESYLSTLSKSVVLYLSQFFQKFMVVSVSAKTGQGFDSLSQSIGSAIKMFNTKSQKQNKKQIQKTESEIAKQMSKLKLDEKAYASTLGESKSFT